MSKRENAWKKNNVIINLIGFNLNFYLVNKEAILTRLHTISIRIVTFIIILEILELNISPIL